MFIEPKLRDNAVQSRVSGFTHGGIVKVVGGSTGILYTKASEPMTETTYTNLRQSLASVLDRVVNDREVVIVRRKGDKKVAMVPADELAGLMETAHLLRSPKNAKRLLSALRRATSRKGKPESLDKLRQELQLASR
jgi:antitoxin YefM